MIEGRPQNFQMNVRLCAGLRFRGSRWVPLQRAISIGKNVGRFRHEMNAFVRLALVKTDEPRDQCCDMAHGRAMVLWY